MYCSSWRCDDTGKELTHRKHPNNKIDHDFDLKVADSFIFDSMGKPQDVGATDLFFPGQTKQIETFFKGKKEPPEGKNGPVTEKLDTSYRAGALLMFLTFLTNCGWLSDGDTPDAVGILSSARADEKWHAGISLLCRVLFTATAMPVSSHGVHITN